MFFILFPNHPSAGPLDRSGRKFRSIFSLRASSWVQGWGHFVRAPAALLTASHPSGPLFLGLGPTLRAPSMFRFFDFFLFYVFLT